MTSSNQSFDLIIVGAGPAGLSTALHLAKLAPEFIARTLILEKARHPRPKLCGGGILPDGEVLLRGLGLDLSEMPHVDVAWAHFDFDGQGFRMRADDSRPCAFRTVRRSEFDAWLAGKVRALGFQILEETKVESVKVAEEGVLLQTSRGAYRARVLVGADGSASLVRRAVIPGEKAHAARTLEVVTPPLPSASFHIQQDSYFDFFAVPHGIQGYTWDFPALLQGKPVRVRGVFDANLRARAPGLSLRACLQEELRRHGQKLEDYELQGAPIRWFEPKAPLSAAHILLVGDAAGTDALYGEGISLALGYGAFAARAIQHAFQQNDFSFRTYKPAILRSDMGKALQMRTWLAKTFYRFQYAPLQRFFWRRLGPAIRWVVRRCVIGWAERQEKRGE